MIRYSSLLYRISQSPLRYISSSSSSFFSSPLSSSSIKVSVNDILTEVLVDTGATISLIHEDVLNRMAHDLPVPCSLKEVHTANCGFISLTGLVKLNVSIGHFQTMADVYVTRDLVCSMILGRDWIHKNQVTLCFSSNRLFVHSGVASTELIPIPRHESFVMFASESIVVPPFHEKFVSGYVPVRSMENALFTPNLAIQHAKLVLLPHSVLHIHDHHGVIAIMNNTRHPKTIPRDTPLGIISRSGLHPAVNVIHPSSATAANSSSRTPSSFHCSHCDIHFSRALDLSKHFMHCCSKNNIARLA